jgi:PAS domain S-box-containing protein
MDKKIKKQVPWFLPIITALIVLSILFWFGMKEQALLIKKEVDETILLRTLLVKIVAKNIENTLVSTKASTDRLASLLSYSFSSSLVPLSDEFNLLTNIWPDGTIRSNKDKYIPLNEAGIVLPNNYELSESAQNEILSAKKIIDAYGGQLANESHVDAWYMPKDGGIVIYWPEESNFIYDAKPDFSYANSEWLVPLPYQNQNKIMSYWTTLSLDPIPNIWMLSAVSPVYVNGDWIGSTGHDIPLVNVLSETSLLEQQKGSTFVLITSKQELLASDIFAGKLKDSNGHVLLSDLSERQWEESFVNASKVEIIKNKHAQSIIDDNLFTVSYIEEQDWFLITSIPLLPIQQTVKNSFNHLSNITIGSIILEILILSILLAWGHRKNIQYIQSLRSLNSELHSEKARYKNLVDKIPSVVYRCKNDQYWTMMYLSDVFGDVTGYETTSVLNNKEISFSELIHPSDREMVNQNIQTAIRNRKLFEVIYRIKHKNGSLKWVLERGQGIFDDSKVTMLEGVITDISELKQTQEELQTLNSRLDHKVKQRTADLEFTNSELQSQKFELARSLTELKATQEQLLEEKKISSLSKLVVGMAHELNTPLGNVIMMISVLEHEIEAINASLLKKELTSKTLNKSLNTTTTALCSASVNVDRMIMLSQKFRDISATDYTKDLTRFDLFYHLSQSIKGYREVLKNQSIAIRINSTEDIDICSSKKTLTLIMKHLVSNSLEHGFTNKESGNIEILISQNSKGICIFYTDDGNGIPTNILESVFDPFTTSARGLGSIGLGLNVVHNLVTHGLKGSIRCNKVKCGVEFEIILPENKC